MDVLTLVAILCFGVAAILAGVQKAWAVSLIGAGLFFVTLAGSHLIK